MEEVQDLEQNGHSLLLQPVDGRQVLIFNERKYGFCSFDIRVDLGIKGEDRLIVRRMVAWNEGGTQLQNVETRFGAVALSEAESAPEGLLRLNAR